MKCMILPKWLINNCISSFNIHIGYSFTSQITSQWINCSFTVESSSLIWCSKPNITIRKLKHCQANAKDNNSSCTANDQITTMILYCIIIIFYWFIFLVCVYLSFPHQLRVKLNTNLHVYNVVLAILFAIIPRTATLDSSLVFCIKRLRQYT